MFNVNVTKITTGDNFNGMVNVQKLKLVIGGFILIPLILLFITNAVVYYIQEDSDTTPFKSYESSNAKGAIEELNKKRWKAKKSLYSLFPKGNYIVIDTSKNILYLKIGDKIVHQTTVSTGSGKFLTDPRNSDRKWVFDTPRGEFTVKSKIVGPVWIKPDWAFIEEGKNVPENYNDRFEEGVLGDYAIDIGNGYLIHGTLYTRLLGKPVTHGCIRVGDDDLKTIYNLTNIGTKVYIF